MTRSKLKAIASILLSMSSLIPLGRAALAEVQLDEQTFAKLQRQIRPQKGESRWMEIPWLIDVHAARQKAAAEGKPLFVYSGGGATGIGAC